MSEFGATITWQKAGARAGEFVRSSKRGSELLRGVASAFALVLVACLEPRGHARCAETSRFAMRALVAAFASTAAAFGPLPSLPNPFATLSAPSLPNPFDAILSPPSTAGERMAWTTSTRGALTAACGSARRS